MLLVLHPSNLRTSAGLNSTRNRQRSGTRVRGIGWWSLSLRVRQRLLQAAHCKVCTLVLSFFNSLAIILVSCFRADHSSRLKQEEGSPESLP